MNRFIVFLFALPLAGWSACRQQPVTPEPTPTPVHVADAAPVPTDPCAAACARLHELTCPAWAASCVSDCGNLDAKLTALHSPLPNHACVAAAADCTAAKACP